MLFTSLARLPCLSWLTGNLTKFFFSFLYLFVFPVIHPVSFRDKGIMKIQTECNREICLVAFQKQKIELPNIVLKKELSTQGKREELTL